MQLILTSRLFEPEADQCRLPLDFRLFTFGVLDIRKFSLWFFFFLSFFYFLVFSLSLSLWVYMRADICVCASAHCQWMSRIPANIFLFWSTLNYWQNWNPGVSTTECENSSRQSTVSRKEERLPEHSMHATRLVGGMSGARPWQSLFKSNISPNRSHSPTGKYALWSAALPPKLELSHWNCDSKVTFVKLGRSGFASIATAFPGNIFARVFHWFAFRHPQVGRVALQWNLIEYFLRSSR